jgi:protocatechuate 3,4-dioxygenase beta subunit
VAEAEVQARLVRAVLELEEPYRTTVLQRYFQGLEATAIAAAAGIPVETVRTRIKRGVALLRERMGRELGDDREAWGLLLLGRRPDRGPRPSPGIPAGAAAVAGGGIAMAIGAKLAMGGAVILAAAAAWWLWPGKGVETASVPPRSGIAAPGAAAPATGRPARKEAAAPKPPAGDGRFLGRVIGSDGAPVAGAAVSATALRPPAAMGSGPATEVQGLSSADGAFELLLPRGTDRADLAASAPGFAVVCVERARAGARVEIRLRAEGVLSGRVLDAGGKPVAGAVVRAFRVLGHEHLDVVSATTGADGAYRVGGFDACTSEANPYGPMRRPFLDVRAEGFGGVQIWGPFPGPGESMRRDVTLYPARPLVVLVTDADSGAPVGEASVNVGLVATGLQIPVPGEPGHMLPHPAPYLDEGTSAPDGRCVLAGAPGRLPSLEQLVVRAWKKGFTAEFLALRERRPSDDERVEIRLWPAVTVRGRVVDAAGNPVAGAGVFSGHGGGSAGSWFPVPTGDLPWQGWVRTDAEGRYELPGIPATADGSRSAFVNTWGSSGLTADGRLFTTFHPIVVEFRPRAGVDALAPDLVLPEPKPARAARFLVVDAGGAPVPDALLTSLTDAARDAPARTDDRGAAVLHWASEVDLGHPVEKEPTLLVTAPGFARTMIRCRPDVDSVPEVRVVLAPGARLEGRVVEKDGTPFAGASVGALCEGPDVFWAPPADSGPDGRFVFEDLPARPFRISVSTAQRYDPAARLAQVEGVLPGRPPVDVVLPPKTEAVGTLVVVVVAEEDGSPLVEAFASVRSDPVTSNAFSDSSSAGVLTMDRVPVGRWMARAWARGRLAATAVAKVNAGRTTRLRFVLARGTPVVLGVEGLPDPGGRAVQGARAMRVDAAPGEPGAGERADGSREEGAWRFDALRPGRYVFTLQVEGLPKERPAAEQANNNPFGEWTASERAPPEVFVSSSPFEVGPPGNATARTAVRLVRGGLLSVRIEDPGVPQPVPHPQSMSGGGAGGGARKEPEDPDAEERVRLEALEHPAALEVLAQDGARQFLSVGVTRGSQEPIPLPPGEFIVRLHLPSGVARDAAVSIEAGGNAALTLGGK